MCSPRSNKSREAKRWGHSDCGRHVPNERGEKGARGRRAGDFEKQKLREQEFKSGRRQKTKGGSGRGLRADRETGGPRRRSLFSSGQSASYMETAGVRAGCASWKAWGRITCGVDAWHSSIKFADSEFRIRGPLLRRGKLNVFLGSSRRYWACKDDRDAASRTVVDRSEKGRIPTKRALSPWGYRRMVPWVRAEEAAGRERERRTSGRNEREWGRQGTTSEGKGGGEGRVGERGGGRWPLQERES